MAVLISGCTSTSSQLVSQKLTPIQRRSLESKELEGKFDDAFKATIAVLQDKSYMIKTSDFESGLIYGETAKEVTNNVWHFKSAYKVTINFEKFTENRTKMRLTIFRQMYNSFGIEIPEAPDSKRLKTGAVENPHMYQDFYNEIQQEMFRREQLNK